MLAARSEALIGGVEGVVEFRVTDPPLKDLEGHLVSRLYTYENTCTYLCGKSSGLRKCASGYRNRCLLKKVFFISGCATRYVLDGISV